MTVRQNATLINNGTLSLNDLVLESANLDGVVNLTNSLRVRTLGTSTLSSGSVVSVDGTTTVESGELRIDAGAQLAGAGVLAIQNNANVDLQGRLNKNATIESGGQLQGVGRIDGILTVAGMLGPGNSAGVLEIEGDLEVEEVGMICIEIGGTTAGLNGYDAINGRSISSASLAGTLDVSLINGFTPSVDDEFFVIDNFASVTGRFANTPGNLLRFQDGEFRVEYGSSFVRLFQYQAVSVPEPCLCSVLTMILISCGLSRHRRSTRRA